MDYDLLDRAAELNMQHAEREGKRLNDILCAGCPDPGLCAAERECCAGGEDFMPDGAI